MDADYLSRWVIIACRLTTCHTGQYALTYTELEDLKAEYNSSLNVLKGLLETKLGYYFSNEWGSPYFFTTPYDSAYVVSYAFAGGCTNALPIRNWMNGGTFTYVGNGTDCFTAGSVNAAGTATIAAVGLNRTHFDPYPTGKFNAYAASNWKALFSEQGAWAHRQNYAKRLIYDSIDWLDDNQFNNSVGVTLDALTTSTDKTNAIEWLLNKDGSNRYSANDPLERP